MTTMLITYRVRSERLDRHLQLLGAIHDELALACPPGVSWISYRDSEDATRFFDLVATDRPRRFSSLSTWAAFRSGLDERCEEPPTMVELRLAASTPTPAEYPT